MLDTADLQRVRCRRCRMGLSVPMDADLPVTCDACKRLPDLPDTVVSRAWNGHTMEYRVTGQRSDGTLITSQWDARCTSTCRACANGDPLPDW